MQESKERIEDKEVEALLKEMKKKIKIQETLRKIPKELERMYQELKETEMVFGELAQKLELDGLATEIEDTQMNERIETIKERIEEIQKKIRQDVDEIELDKVKAIAKQTQMLMEQDENIEDIYEELWKKNFEKSFDDKVQDLIREDALNKLKKKKEQVEQEKITFLGNLMGEKRLKQARIDHLNLKMQLLIAETQTKRENAKLEESIVDLYTYMQSEVAKKKLPEIQQFYNIVEKEEQIEKIVDKKQIEQKVKERVNHRASEAPVVPFEKNKKISNRRMASILEMQNGEISRRIQKNRAKVIIEQKNEFVIKREETKDILNQFQTLLDEIEKCMEFDKNY